METDESEVPDHHVYRDVTFYPHTVRFFVAALKHYAGRLKADLDALEDEPELRDVLLQQSRSGESKIERERGLISRFIQMFEQHLTERPDAPDYEITISRGNARLLKSICELYIEHLRQQRDLIANRPTTSLVTLQQIDTRVTELSEKLHGGIFKSAEPWPLSIQIAADTFDRDAPRQLPSRTEPMPRIVSTIEIVDSQLRERCLDLFNTFSANEQPHRYDTVIQEATRILEERLRALSHAGIDQFGADLATFAFKPAAPKLILGETPAEKEAVHQLYRGVFGFIRNPFHHRLIDDLRQERVVQLLGLIDYLIYLAETAHPSAPTG